MKDGWLSAVGLAEYELSADEELLTNVITGAAVRAPRGTGRQLAACRAFSSLDEHERRLIRAGAMKVEPAAAGIGPTPLRAALERLRDCGLLVDFAGFVRWLSCDQESPERDRGTAGPARITEIVVPTRNRRAQLLRNLLGFLLHARTHDRRVRVIVADQSPGDDEATRLPLRAMAAQHGHHAFFIGPAQLASYISRLSRYLGADPAVLEFGFGDPLGVGCSPGANRNALLLATTDQLVLSVDDDIVCRVGGPVAGRSPCRLSVAASAAPAWSAFPTRRAVLDAVPEQSWDALAQAESVLGLPIADCLGQLDAQAVRVDGLEARTLLATRGAVVRVATFGISGDAGTPAGRRAVLALEGELRQQIGRDDEAYRVAASSREVHHVAGCLTIHSAPQCMAGAMALDRRIAGAPFLPVGVGEDGVFGLVLRAAYPNALMAALPCSFLHAPEAARTIDSEFLERSGASPTLAEIVELGLGLTRYGPFTMDPLRRLRQMGESLGDLAHLPAPEFWDIVRRERWRRLSVDIARLDRLLRQYNRQPGAWACDVDRYCAAARKGSTLAAFYTPRDLLAGRSPEGARTCAQTIVQAFATLLVEWPNVVQANSELRQRGTCLETSA